MFHVITLNLNGIRAAERKGFFKWIKHQHADVICLQELKAQKDQLQDDLFSLPGYYSDFFSAEKKGYSGVAIYSRYQPKKVIKGLGFNAADQEGRYIAFDLGSLWVASLYMPSGTSGDERQAIKFDFLKQYTSHLQSIQSSQKQMIICGDFNIAHRPIDLKNWRANQKHSGFLPEERAWMDQLFDHLGFIDAFRLVNPETDQYTWWSNRGRAWEKNVGWRIDYQVITPQLKPTVKSAFIYKEERFSDHAPLSISYDIIL
ncbi:MAG: exodeoxyribonuclease III [Gammaproteobacteria bacterium RIFCSPHIGHO2_12_FULL_38_14]|nr:MAG: exodeoxyribonuclease III [Gammaproteobacteria bacterium RIFCSPHIGHO2_12_FULL_38_14]